MEFLHTMIRVSDVDASLRFFCDGLGLKKLKQYDNEKGRFSLIFLASAKDVERAGELEFKGAFPTGLPMIELTHNWDESGYEGGRNFGHLAYRVSDIYGTCQHLMDMGYTISRPPRDGHMAFIRSPDNISVELLQEGEDLPSQEPWASMENVGEW